MLIVAVVALGGAIGTILRYFISAIVYDYFRNPVFPWGTVIINLTGSLIIGLLAGWNEASPFQPNLRLFLFVGLLGGFTTFSAYSLETINLFKNSLAGLAILNILISNIGGILCAAGGFLLMKNLSSLLK